MDKETLFLMFVVGLLLWISLGNLWGHTLNHSMPIGTLASDNFLHLHYPEYLLESKTMQYTSVAASSGFNDVIWHYGVILSPLAAIFSKMSGLKTYDSLMFIVYFFAIIASLVMYFCIKKFSMKIAILSLPLTVFLFSRNFYFIFLWGQYQMLIANLFAFLAIWALININKKKIFILLAIFISVSFIAHASEAMVIVAFILFFYLIKLIFKKINFSELKEIGKAGILSVILLSYYLLIFKNSYLPGFEGKSLIDLNESYTEYLRTVYLSSFGLITIIIIVGIILILLIKKIEVVTLYPIFMILFGYANFLGGTLGTKSIPQRFMWPISLSLLFGFVLYFMIMCIPIKIKKTYIMIISIAITLLFVQIYYVKMGPSSLINQEQWDSIMWIKENTPHNSKILFLYGDVYTQHGILYNTLRDNYIAKDYIDSLKNNSIKRNYLIYNVGEYVWKYPYKKGIISFGRHTEEINLTIVRDICNFDYLHLDIESRISVISQYNKIVLEELMDVGFIKIFGNRYSVVLKNTKLNQDCMPEVIELI